MRRKPTIDFIRADVEKKGHKLITDIYINSKQKLELVCPRGHTWFVSWNHWDSAGVRCPYCYFERRSPSIDFIRNEFKKEGYILLSDVYVNNRTRLYYICPSGHKHWITWGHWNTSKARCPYCSGRIKYSLYSAVQKFRNINYILLADEYINSKINMRCMCDKGHIVYICLWEQF